MPDITADNFDQNHVNNPEWKDAEQVGKLEKELKDENVQFLFSEYNFNRYD